MEISHGLILDDQEEGICLPTKTTEHSIMFYANVYLSLTLDRKHYFTACITTVKHRSPNLQLKLLTQSPKCFSKRQDDQNRRNL